jgi:hypothetical protein
LFSSVGLFVLIEAEKTTRSAVAYAGIGIPARRTLGEGGLPMGHWQGINAAVHKTASPETFRD